MPIPHLKKTYSPQEWRKANVSLAKTPGDRKSFRMEYSRFGLTRKSFFYRLFKKLLWLGIAGGLLAMIIFGIFFINISADLPNPDKIIERNVAQSTQILDRTGKTILYSVYGDRQRSLVNLTDIPAYAVQAVLTAEDRDFYQHHGFKLSGIVRAFLSNMSNGQQAGGSTITQQFVKNAVLTNEKTYTRKLKELIISYQLENKFSKDQILKMYFNEIPYGSTAYGIQTASQLYFGKNVQNISLAESAILAAMLKSPSYLSPYGSHTDELFGRQLWIIDEMVNQGYITREAAEAAKNEKLTFKKIQDKIIAPHFVMYIRELLAKKYGERALEEDGLKVYTTIDLYKQGIAEEVIKSQGDKNETKFKATDAALISLDPKNGEILAMVGSRDYFNEEIDGQVNVTLRPRQPGSSFKPIVYAASFVKGYTPDTVLYDVVTDFKTDIEGTYTPHDYDGKERGPVTVRQALAGSLNIPAVKMLYLTGVENALTFAEKLGYSTLSDRSRFGLSLVLGGGEVTLLEHARAFTAFARDGLQPEVTAILKIEDKDGKVIFEAQPKTEQVIDSQIARQINSILSNNSARAYIFGENNSLTLPNRPVAAKTGTTNDYKDAWTIGYTPSLLTGVWVGNANSKEMSKGADGSIVAAPIWQGYMKRVLGDTPAETFKEPDPVEVDKPVLKGDPQQEITVKIDKTTGKLATEFTPLTFIEEKKFSQPHTILYFVNKDDPRGPAPTNPTGDPQYEGWERAILHWATTTAKLTLTLPPTEYDDSHTMENQPSVVIQDPVANSTVRNAQIAISVSAYSKTRQIKRVEIFIDDTPIASMFGNARAYTYDARGLENGFHALKATVFDDIDNSKSDQINFNFLINQKTWPAINFLYPTANYELSFFDFPYLIQTDAKNSSLIEKIEIRYYESQKDKNQSTLIGSINAPNEGLNTLKWIDPLLAGTYNLYAAIYMKDGESFISAERTITVKAKQ